MREHGAKVTHPAEPVALEAYIGSFHGRSYGVWWNGARLVYESVEPGFGQRRERVCAPSEAQWRAFWRTIDDLDVWHWESHYGAALRFEPSTIVRDGTHWSLTLERGDRRIESSGDSAAPDANDLDDSPVFTAFCAAIARLAGDRAFA
jgi:hypothetical protein